MCTVSYLPKSDGYILTSNRDESPDRSITEIVSLPINGHLIHFPRDPLAGGSWLAVSESGQAACLLNGAFEPFDQSIKYRDSRGHVLLNSFEYDGLEQVAKSYHLTDTAPFTLLMAGNEHLEQLIWDGTTAHFEILDNTKPHFWSSVTLYARDVREHRKALFQNWLKMHSSYQQREIVEFHEFGNEHKRNGFVMNRDEVVKTLSITCVEHTHLTTELTHRNLNEPKEMIRRVVINHDALVEEA